MQFQHARMLLELGMLEISVALLVVLCLWLLTRRRQAPASFSKVPWSGLGLGLANPNPNPNPTLTLTRYPAGRCFDARRWLEPDGSRSPPPDVVIPFGHGLRLCPGKDLALLESLVCVGRVLQVFALGLPPGHPEVGTMSQATQEPNCDVCIGFNPRE